MYKELFCLFVLVSPHAAQIDDDNTDRPKGCNSLPNPDHGTFTIDPENRLIAHIRCDRQYEVKGLNPIYCYNDRWPKDIPTCVFSSAASPISTDFIQNFGAYLHERPKICALPPNPEHGTYTSDPDNFRIAHVSCDQNYVVQGLKSVNCYNNRWPEHMPKCVPNIYSEDFTDKLATIFGSALSSSGCPLLPNPEHGSYTLDSNNLVAHLRCDQNYAVKGSESVYCYEDRWPEQMPTCIPTITTQRPLKTSGSCVLPPYPGHGAYTTNVAGSRPGDRHEIVSVNVTCQQGYGVNGPHFIFCSDGQWSSQLPQCVPLCRLASSPSVEYRCLVSLEFMDGFRTCNEYEPSGTLISPLCRPHYYSATSLKYMRCIDGEWYNIPACTPECGTLIPDGTQLVIGGEPARLGEVPWHAGIYRKETSYTQICGGSLISNKILISAAHCFWSNLVGKLPASDFAVAVGKLYRNWNSKMDKPQRSEVKSIMISTHFRGSATNFQDDIAVVELVNTVVFDVNVRPVCVDFEPSFERRQLRVGNKGKVAGWGLTAENGAPSRALLVTELPYVPVDTCIDSSPASFSAYITSDKFCAGVLNEKKALCRGDSGGGLAFLDLDKGTPRYYLRGVVSTAPTSDNLCNANSYTTFTRLIKHELLIKLFWGDS